jgi:hypothetical protein
MDRVLAVLDDFVELERKRRVQPKVSGDLEQADQEGCAGVDGRGLSWRWGRFVTQRGMVARLTISDVLAATTTQ